MRFSKKRALAVALAALSLLGLAAGGMYLKRVADYQRTVRAIAIPDLSFENLPDGSYIGECDVDLIYARVEVVVDGGSVSEIRILEHRNGRGLPAERIVEDMTAQRSLQVDAVTGATNSSIVLKKAAANALECAGAVQGGG